MKEASQPGPHWVHCRRYGLDRALRRGSGAGRRGTCRQGPTAVLRPRRSARLHPLHCTRHGTRHGTSNRETHGQAGAALQAIRVCRWCTRPCRSRPRSQCNQRGSSARSKGRITGASYHGVEAVGGRAWAASGGAASEVAAAAPGTQAAAPPHPPALASFLPSPLARHLTRLPLHTWMGGWSKSGE